MLFTQPLPPQFLLPAWSARQLASAVQRAYHSDIPDTSPLRATKIVAKEPAELLNSKRIESGPISKHKWGHHRLAELPLESNQIKEAAGEKECNLEQPKIQIQEHNVQQQETRGPIADNKSEENLYSKPRWHRLSTSADPDSRARVTKPSFPNSTEQLLKRGQGQHKIKAILQNPQLSYHRDLHRLPKTAQSTPKEQDAALLNDVSSFILPRKTRDFQKQNSKPASEPPNTQKTKPKRRVSLFEELFPELTLPEDAKEIDALDNLARLPAFDWKTSNALDKTDEHQETKSRNYIDRPQTSDEFIKFKQSRSRYEPLWEDEPSVLVLNFSSAQLEESDFFRVGAKGEHIENWTSGIVKVIPAREEDTLRFKGHYYLIFSSDAAARAYLDQTIRLHTLSQMRGIDRNAYIPPPPGYLQKGEDINTALLNFSLVPGHSQLSLRMMNRPYTPYMQRTLRYGGPVAAASQQVKTEHMVLFYLETGYISLYDLRGLLMEDGTRRNLHWKLAGGYDNIFRVKEASGDEEKEKGASRRLGYGAARYIVPFANQQEARRFVREWHRQPLPVERETKAGDEFSSIVNAELIW